MPLANTGQVLTSLVMQWSLFVGDVSLVGMQGHVLLLADEATC